MKPQPLNRLGFCVTLLAEKNTQDDKIHANLIAPSFKPHVPWNAHQRRKKRNKNWKLLSRRQQPSNWGRGLHPRHALWLTPLESQHRLTQLTHHV